MPKQKRLKTKYPGVYYIQGQSLEKKPEKIFYIMYRNGGRLIEEKAGRQFQDDMTAARASNLRTERIRGHQPSNKEKRQNALAENEAKEKRWTIYRLWEEYKRVKPDLKGIGPDESRYRRYLHKQFGDREPKDLLPLDVDRLRLKNLNGKSPQTKKLVISLLRRICYFGSNRQFCDPLSFKIEIPAVNNEKTEALTPAQILNLLEAIENDPHPHAGSMMLMALCTGMRRGEMFRLKWQDIDFQRGFIFLRDPKSGQDEKIPLNKSARKLLQSHPRTESVFVFPGRNGNQRTDINHQLSRIREVAGLPKEFRPLHGLRHVFASTLACSGLVSLYEIQKLLTHKYPTTTQRYTHLTDARLKQASDVAADIIDGIFRESGEKVEETSINQ